MVKKILFIQNRTGIKRSNFFDHWENIHAPHMVKVLKPKKYILTFFEEDFENGCCGMAELWFENEKEYQDAMEKHTQAMHNFGYSMQNPAFRAVARHHYVQAHAEVGKRMMGIACSDSS